MVSMLCCRLPFPRLDVKELRLHRILDRVLTHLLSCMIGHNDLFLFRRVYGELREPFGIWTCSSSFRCIRASLCSGSPLRTIFR
jgi:hypothetical protein